MHTGLRLVDLNNYFYDVFLTKIDSKKYMKMIVVISNYLFLTKKKVQKKYTYKK